MPEMHPDDEFHPPTSDDPEWTETCWFTFTVPERGPVGPAVPLLQAQPGRGRGRCLLLGRAATTGPRPASTPSSSGTCPLPDEPLTDIDPPQRHPLPLPRAPAAAGRCATTTPTATRSTSISPSPRWPHPTTWARATSTRPGRYQGTIVLHGEEIPVDAYGFRDRSWGPRPQFGQGIHGGPMLHGGYSYATASPDDAFHSHHHGLGQGLHRHPRLPDPRRRVVEGGQRRPRGRRARRRGLPAEVVSIGSTSSGREIHAEGTHPQLARFPDQPEPVHGQLPHRVDASTGVTAWGEDHDNHSFPDARRLLREARGQSVWS